MSTQPMELELWFAPPEVNGKTYLDIAQCVSLVNRKFIRQGCQFAVKNIELFGLDPTSEISVQISRLPNHWPMVNAWVKAFHVWRDVTGSGS